MAYSTVYLLDGTHEIHSLTKDEPDGVLLASPYQPLLNSFSNKQLLITTLICSDKPQCTNTRATILIGDPLMRFDITYPTTFRNVIINGKKTLIAGCSAAECFYCPIVHENEMGVITSDKGTVLSAGEYAPQSECDKYNAVALMSVSSGVSLLLEEVDFFNIRYQPKAIIFSNGGFLKLSRVNFKDIVVSGAVVLQEECDSPPYGCGSLEYSQGSVSYLNNGYEFTDTLHVSGFLQADGLGDIKITSVTFTMNIATNPKDQYHALITLVRFRSMTLQSSSFTYNIVTNLLSIQATELTLAQTLDDLNNAVDYAIEHVVFDAVTVNNNLVVASLMSALYAHDLQSMRLASCTIKDNVSRQSVLFSIVYQEPPTTDATEGERKIVKREDGSFVLAYFAPRHAIMTDSVFTGNLGTALFTFRGIANIQLSGSGVFTGNGASETITYNDLVLKHFVDDTDAYIDSYHATTSISKCTHLLLFDTCFSVSLTTLIFSSNYCDSGVAGVEATQIAHSFLIQSLQFVDNIAAASDGTVLSIHDTMISVHFQSVTFSNNQNTAGAGTLYFGPALAVKLISCTFLKNRSTSGSGIWANDPLKISISASTFDSNISTKGNGGAIALMVEAGTDLHSLEIVECLLNNNQGSQGGGLYVFGDKPTRPFRIQITSTSFKANVATTLGGAIFIETNLALTIDSKVSACTFTENKSTKGTILVLFASGTLAIIKSTFTLNQAQTGAGIASSTGTFARVTINDSIFTFNSSPGGVVALTEIDHVKELQTTNCYFASNSGLCLSLQRAIWTDSTSSYLSTDGSAVVLSEKSEAKVTASNFQGNTAIGSGGAVGLYRSSAFKCTRCSFVRNAAGDKGGAIFLEQMSSIDIIESSFSENSSVDKGAALFILNSLETISSVTSTTFTFNTGINTGVVSLVLSALSLVNATFDRNTSKGITPGIDLDLSTLTVKDSKFMKQAGKLGAFIFITSESFTTITNSSFTEATAEYGGAFSVIGSTFHIASSNLTYIHAVSGAGFVAYSQSDVSLVQVRMAHLTASESSIGLMSEGKLRIENCIFSYFSSGGMSADSLTQAVVTKSTFSNGNGVLGGAFACTRCWSVQILSSVFTNNFANSGGALYLTTQVESPPGNAYQVKDCVFLNNTGWKAAAVYLDNVGAGFDYCKFVNNAARKPLEASQQRSGTWGSGGALITDCKDVESCYVSVTNCYFAHNSAEESGGAISWSDVRPYVFNTTFLRNSAEYGSDISSFAVSLREPLLGRMLAKLSSVPSGQLAKEVVVLRVVDHYGQVVAIDNSSFAELVAANSTSTTLSGQTKVTAMRGIFTFDSFIITAEPRTSVQINIQSSAIDISKSIKGNDSVNYVTSVSLSAEMRDCVMGESRVGMTCHVCETGKYSLNPNSTLCANCPYEAICYGNYTMVPKAGYWRARFDTDVFYSCFYPPSCVGSLEPPAELSFTGNCAVGYQGRLCQSCANGFSKSSKYKCDPCPNDEINAIRLVFIAVAIGILVGIMVFTTMRSAYREKSQASIVIKLFMNYLQIVILVATFNLDWPELVLDLFNVHETAGSFTEQVISIDCYLTSTQSTSVEDLVYGKLTVMAIVPIFISDVALFVWILIYWKRREQTFPRDGLIATIVILLFLVHPTITKYMFDIFACIEIDGQYYLLQAVDVSCWNAKHIFYIVTCAIPSIVLWVIGAPAICLLYLVKNRQLLGSISERVRLGFLFNGFRSHAYYWEFVIMYRKILIICCSVFLATISIPMQALCVTLVLIAALYLQDAVQPYTTQGLNRMELESITSAAITIYCGLFFLTGDLGEEARTILFVCIVAVNALFISHWLRTLLDFYVTILANSIPFVRRRFGYIHKVRDDLDDDLFVRSHEHDALKHGTCCGFTPTIKAEGSKLQTMKDVYMMKLTFAADEFQRKVKPLEFHDKEDRIVANRMTEERSEMNSAY